MKVFILALSVLVLAALLVAADCWYIGRLCGELLRVVAGMPGETGDLSAFDTAYREFERTWVSGEKWMHILVGHEAADRVTELLTETGMRYLGRDDAGYMAAREQLCRQLEKIREGESLSADSIL